MEVHQLWKRFFRDVRIKRERYNTEKALPALPKLVNDENVLSLANLRNIPCRAGVHASVARAVLGSRRSIGVIMHAYSDARKPPTAAYYDESRGVIHQTSRLICIWSESYGTGDC